MKKVQLNEAEKGLVVLSSEQGFQMNCPFKPDQMQKTALGQMQYVAMPCNSLCPHFEVLDGDTVQLTCSGIAVEMEVVKPASPIKLS